jgi:carboxyl-terminal processing protease
MPSEMVVNMFELACCRAEIVGEQTFGKGIVQYYFPMTDGSGIKLTIAKYLTPGPFDITKSGGLHPDHVCSDFPHGDRVMPENDTCIQDALRLIGQSS